MQLTRSDRNRGALTPWFTFPSVFDDEFFSIDLRTDMNMWEDEDKVYVEAAVPGMKENDIDVMLENGVLTIRATKEEDSEEKKGKRKVYSSSMKSNYYYSTTLPSNAGQDVSADLEDGVLRLEIPKSEESKPRKIEVKRKKS
jgi:HSP20 family protein